jgi:uncharacterized protein
VKDAFYGRGASFPWALSSTGGIRESAGLRKVEESIRVVLGTQYGERVMRPTFGCNLKSLAFAPNHEATANLARHYVEDGLRQWEPRIELLEVRVENDRLQNALMIHVHYRVKATQDVRSLVYPFYLENP